MNSDSAVIFLVREPTGSAKPLLLHKILFSPAVLWLCRSLQLSGVKRFFVVSEPESLADSITCFPPDAVVLTADDPELDERLSVFSAGAEGPLITVTNPVWLSFAAAAELAGASSLPSNGECTGLYRVQREVLAAGGMAAVTQGEGYAPVLDPDPILLPLRTPADLAHAQYCARLDNTCRWMSLGVQVLDLNTVYIDIDVDIGSGTALLPNTILRGNTRIGRNCEIGPGTMIRDCVLGDGCVANASQLNEAQFGNQVNIGPFAYIRPGSHVADGCKVGDFVELKNSTLGEGTKLPHLIYVGDSDVGAHCNFGCGSITCNYDGNFKYRTTVGDNAFIGCNTNLVSPCQVEDGAYTAAGTTITDRVPADALAIGRAESAIKEGWASCHRAKKKKEKQP